MAETNVLTMDPAEPVPAEPVACEPAPEAEAPPPVLPASAAFEGHWRISRPRAHSWTSVGIMAEMDPFGREEFERLMKAAPVSLGRDLAAAARGAEAGPEWATCQEALDILRAHKQRIAELEARSDTLKAEATRLALAGQHDRAAEVLRQRRDITDQIENLAGVTRDLEKAHADARAAAARARSGAVKAEASRLVQYGEAEIAGAEAAIVAVLQTQLPRILVAGLLAQTGRREDLVRIHATLPDNPERD